jgi:Ser/Thr protein kinase RdoA (MazF antagonist)
MTANVLYSTFSADFIARCVQAEYPLSTFATCELFHRGLNDTYRVRTETDQYAFRVYRSDWRSERHVEAEVAAIDAVAARGVRSAKPIARSDGGWVTLLDAPEGPRCSVLFAWAGGREPRYADAQDAETYGRTAALLHSAGDQVGVLQARPQIDLSALLEEPLAHLRPALEGRSSLSYLEDLASRIRRALTPERLQGLDWGFCHGDLHCGNATIDDARRLTLFDFDCCGSGWRAFDLATYRWAARLREHERVAWPAFRRGYGSVRAIGDADLAVVPVFMLLRCFWLMGLEAARAPLIGVSRLNADYFRGAEAFCRSLEAEAFGVLA